MADQPRESKFFDRLERMFSASIILRKSGTKQLKVFDIGDKQNTYQNLATNFFTDRFTRLYQAKRHYQTARVSPFLQQRLRLYQDYELMDQDSIVSSAFDIYADESTTANSLGEILTIKTSNEQVKDVLHNLYYDILNIDYTGWQAIRNMLKYGDCYWLLHIVEGLGIINYTPLSVYDVVREEAPNGDGSSDVRFMYEGIDGKGEYSEYEVAHFRHASDTNFFPYGKSIAEAGRREWKKLQLMEDAMLIHRVMRAPEKRVFKVDVGSVPPEEIDMFMNSIMSQIRKSPLVDPQTGDYNLEYNMMNMTEDFWLPVRGGDSGTQIESLGGLNFDANEDVEYFKSKVISSLKVPKAFLGYDENVVGKATLAQEDVRFARTIQRVQKMVISELKKVGIVHLLSQGFTGEEFFDIELSLNNPSTILQQEHLEIFQTQMSLARDAQDAGIPSSIIYRDVFKYSDEEIQDVRYELTKDWKRYFRRDQIRNEGNDPFVSNQKMDSGGAGGAGGPGGEGGESGMGGGDMGENLGTGEHSNKVGRPTEGPKYGKDGSARGRDPLGKDDMGTYYNKDIRDKYAGGSPMALQDGWTPVEEDLEPVMGKTQGKVGILSDSKIRGLDVFLERIKHSMDSKKVLNESNDS